MLGKSVKELIRVKARQGEPYLYLKKKGKKRGGKAPAFRRKMDVQTLILFEHTQTTQQYVIFSPPPITNPLLREFNLLIGGHQ